MYAEWSIDGLIPCAEGAAEYDIPDDQWRAYVGLLNLASEVEDRLRAECSMLPDDLKALKGVLSYDEIQAIVRLRRGTGPPPEEPSVAPPVTHTPTGADVFGVDPEFAIVTNEPIETTELVVRTPEPRDCPQHRGKVHVPSRYGLLSDTRETGKVMAWCSCGHVFINRVGCPHQKQNLLGERSGPIDCLWCGRIMIGASGAIGLDEAMKHKNQSLPPVDVHSFEGNA
jgi:hypothetical protein